MSRRTKSTISALVLLTVFGALVLLALQTIAVEAILQELDYSVEEAEARRDDAQRLSEIAEENGDHFGFAWQSWMAAEENLAEVEAEVKAERLSLEQSEKLYVRFLATSDNRTLVGAVVVIAAIAFLPLVRFVNGCRIRSRRR